MGKIDFKSFWNLNTFVNLVYFVSHGRINIFVESILYPISKRLNIIAIVY